MNKNVFMEGSCLAAFTLSAATVLNMMGFLVTLLTLFFWTKVLPQAKEVG
jgi:hypothetical protein